MLWIISAAAGDAAIGIARGGEHKGFTRVTVQFESSVEIEAVSENKDGSFRITLNLEIERLNTDTLYNRLQQERLKKLIANDGEVILDLGCDCEIEASVFDGNIIVIDISDIVSRNSNVSGNILPIAETGRSQTMFNSSGVEISTDRSELIEKLVKKASSFPVNVVVSDPTTRETPSNPDRLAKLDTAEGRAASVSAQKGSCDFEKSIWEKWESLIDSDLELDDGIGLAYFDSNIVDHSAASSETDVNLLILNAFRLASFPIQGRRDEGNYQKIIESIYTSSNDASINEIRRCSPLSEVALAVMSKSNFLALSRQEERSIIELLNSLPLGWQLEYYPKLVDVSGRNDHTLFAELEAHRELENSMWEVFSGNDDGVSGVSTWPRQPDAAAAVARELRGTELELESWRASQEAYVAAQRYFDALAALEVMPRVTPLERSRLVNRTLNSVARAADDTTILQIVSDEILKFGKLIEADVAFLFRDRLVDAGFEEQASAFLRQLPIHSIPKGSELGGPSVHSEVVFPELSATSSFEEGSLKPESNREQSLKLDGEQPSARQSGDTMDRQTTGISISVAQADLLLRSTQSFREGVSDRFAFEAEGR